MRKTISLLLAMALLLSLGTTAFAAIDEADEDGVVDYLPDEKPALEDDLYGYVNFEPVSEAEIPPGYLGWSYSAELSLEIEQELSQIVLDCVDNAGTYEKGTPEQKIADQYLAYMDEESRNAAGVEPLRPFLDKIASAENIQQYAEILAGMDSDIGYYSLLGFSISSDFYVPDHYSVYLNAADLGLDQPYLLSDDMADLWQLYTDYLTKLFTLSGVDEAEAAEKAASILEMQKQLAASSLSPEEYYDYSKCYIPTAFEDIDALLPTVDLDAVMQIEGLPSDAEIYVEDPGQLEAIGALLTEENLPLLKDYSTAILLMDTAYYLSMDFWQANRDFVGARYGMETPTLEEGTLYDVQSDLAWDFGRIYIKDHFSEESKQYVEDMTRDILGVFEKHIDALDWMSDETKQAAKRKLETMNLKIGYPDDDAWPEYLDEVEYTAPADGGVLIENILNSGRVYRQYMETLPGTEVDKKQWGMTPQEVNAYYSPSNNEIVFPAAIIQGAFYDPDASYAANLGGIGATIAHEITHAFDSSGAQFDENGNYSVWWTEEDMDRFNELCDKVADYYSAIEVIPGQFINGELTLGENIADLGAMSCVAELCGDDPEALREMFLTYALTWGEKMTEDGLVDQLLNDEHAPGAVRVNAVVSSTDAFYEAFDVQEGDGMYVAPEDRVGIW